MEIAPNNQTHFLISQEEPEEMEEDEPEEVIEEEEPMEEQEPAEESMSSPKVQPLV